MQIVLHILSVALVGASIFGGLNMDNPQNPIVKLVGGSENMIYVFVATAILVVANVAYPKLVNKDKPQNEEI